MRTLLTSFACIVLATGSVIQSPETTPRVFAPGVISTGNVYRGAFSPDGKSFYFFRNVTKGREDYRILVSHESEGGWTEPVRVPLGGDYSDLYPSISPDGKRMVFSSYRAAPGASSGKPNANLWYVDRTEAGWGKPVFMARASTLENYDASPSFGPDGEIYFSTTSPDWKTTRAMVTRWTGETYGEPEAFDPVQRWVGWREGLHVWGGIPGPGGAIIILEISRVDSSGERGPADLWVTFYLDGEWTEPRPLFAGVNTDGNENFVHFTPDGKWLGFVRDFSAFYLVDLNVALHGPSRDDGRRRAESK